MSGFTFAHDPVRNSAIGEGARPWPIRPKPAMIPAAAIREPVTRDLFDPYPPELHYMRGPGPKWRAKHAGTATALFAGADDGSPSSFARMTLR